MADRFCAVCMEGLDVVALEWCPMDKVWYCGLCHVDCETCRE